MSDPPPLSYLQESGSTNRRAKRRVEHPETHPAKPTGGFRSCGGCKAERADKAQAWPSHVEHLAVCDNAADAVRAEAARRVSIVVQMQGGVRGRSAGGLPAR